jgi:hypothetical protein
LKGLRWILMMILAALIVGIAAYSMSRARQEARQR